MIDFGTCPPFRVLASSGALGFDGLGWPWERPLVWAGVIDPKEFVVVAKTVTDQPRAGNLRWAHPWTCVRRVGKLGTVNAVGLTNHGVDRWVAEDLPRARKAGVMLAASVKPDTPSEAKRMASLLKGLGLPFIEVNVSCPNLADGDLKGLHTLSEFKETGTPVVIKLSLDQARDGMLVRLFDEVVDGYHAINSVPWNDVYSDCRSPIQDQPHGLQGGVSGPAILPCAVSAVYRVRKETNKPVIGGGGVFSSNDAASLFSAGADAVSIGTCFLYRPWRPTRIARELKRSWTASH